MQVGVGDGVGVGVAVGVGVGVAVQGNGSVKTHPAPSMIFNCNNSSFGKKLSESICTVGGMETLPDTKKQLFKSQVHKNTSYGLVPLVTPVISIII